MRVTQVFTDLKNRLANAKVGSLEHEEIEEKILAENKKVQEVSTNRLHRMCLIFHTVWF